MDPLDPQDLPFADDDPDPLIISIPAPTPQQEFSAVLDFGDSKTLTLHTEDLGPRPSGEAEFLKKNGSETGQILQVEPSSTSPTEESDKTVWNETLSQKPYQELAEMNQHSLKDSNSKNSETDVSEVTDGKVWNERCGGVNGNPQKPSGNCVEDGTHPAEDTDIITIITTSSSEQTSGGEGEKEGGKVEVVGQGGGDVPSEEENLAAFSVDSALLAQTVTQSSCPVDEIQSVKGEGEHGATEETEHTVTVSIQQEETENIEQRGTESIEEKETEIIEEKETEISIKQRETEFIEQRETEIIEQRETESTEERETESSQLKETDNIEQRGTEIIEERETEISTKDRETEFVQQKETEIIEQRETESIKDRETESIKDRETESGEERETESDCQRDTENRGVEISVNMDPQGETHGGGGGKPATAVAGLADDFFGPTSATTSENFTNGVRGGDSSECVLRIDEAIDSVEKQGSASRPRLGKEGSPEIIVDSVENVTLKDATSEKALLGNREDEGSSSSQRDSLSSRTDEDKRKSSSDMDMDFTVLELDSSHLNLEMSKQKTSLRKRGSLARRKKPSRESVTHMASDSSDTMFQDSTDSKPLTSPSSDMAEDEVFHKQARAAESQQTQPALSGGVRKAAQPFKPSLVMPGLQDLTQSKLFNQERNKSDEGQSPPVRSPKSPLSPSHRPNPPPPLVLPKPTSKVQKDSQNKTIAAENSTAHASPDAKPAADTSNVFNNSSNSSSAVPVSVEGGGGSVAMTATTRDPHSDSAGSCESPRAGQSDSASLPKFMRADSWSSVSGPRQASRRESMSSVEGGGEITSSSSSPISTPRRASIQGSAYAPMGFRPRRSSSIVLDSGSKLVDVPPVPSSPSPSSSSTMGEKDTEAAVVGSGEVKPPAPPAFAPPPAWLSEMKTKTAFFPSGGDAGGRLRSTSVGSNNSNDGSSSNAVSASSGRSRNSSGSAEGAQHGWNTGGGGGGGGGVGGEGAQKRQAEDEAERPPPSWVRAAGPQRTTTTPQVSDALPGKNDDEEKSEEEKTPVPPPWAADLKRKSHSFKSTRISDVFGESNGKMATAPYKATADKDNAPVVHSGRDEYSPSWMKGSQQGKRPPPPVVPVKPVVSHKPAGKPSTDTNPMRQYDTPRWKLDLAEKKKRREAEMMPTIEDNDKPSDATDEGDSSRVPQWRQQLSQRKNQPTPQAGKGQPTPQAGKGQPTPQAGKDTEKDGAGSDWAKQTAERRARLMKSGLFNPAEAAEES